MKKTILLIATVLLTIPAIFAQNKRETALRMASYNLRMGTASDGENHWRYRKEMVHGLIRFHELDIIGTQEGFQFQLDDITEPGDYASVGSGRDDGKEKGEHSAILYRVSRFELLDNGDFWYSETPDMPSKGWDATCCNRICSWAKFMDKETERSFFVFNSHFDHMGKLARKHSSLLLLKRIEEIAGDGTVFATGDFNARPDEEPIQIISHSGKFNDARLVSQRPPYGTEGTFNGFNLEASMKVRIDYIWVTPDVTVEKYGVLNDMPYGRFPSDHFPIVADVRF